MKHLLLCRGPRYLEVDVDVGSSQTAARVVGIVQGALKGLVIDIAVLLEGKTKVTSTFPKETANIHWHTVYPTLANNPVYTAKA